MPQVKKYASQAERQAAYRQRKKQSDQRQRQEQGLAEST